ncbi:hypothetical protein [Brenneria rubrifaciens]|nr:hypothetical protein [Brenneria rubrifaciens]
MIENGNYFLHHAYSILRSAEDAMTAPLTDNHITATLAIREYFLNALLTP